jgi:hypothetical protein
MSVLDYFYLCVGVNEVVNICLLALDRQRQSMPNQLILQLTTKQRFSVLSAL